MNTKGVEKSGAVATYPELLKRVRETLILGQRNIEREKVRTYWETGRHIHRHMLQNKGRAEYGKEVVIRLARDLDISDRLLYRCLQFSEKFPILSTWTKSSHQTLTWSHYRALFAIREEERRLALATRAVRSEWGARELEQAVKRVTAKYHETSESERGGRKTFEPLTPKKGTPYLYQIRAPQPIEGESELKIDLGFRVRRKLSEFKASRGLKPGDIVESRPAGKHYEILKAKDKTAKDLFTYPAQVLRVVDGDTLYVEIDLGLGTTIEEYLRLRGIDAPELDTAKGREARAFVQKELGLAPSILLRSSQTDQWDRYVADVFYTTSGGEHFLNNRLLEEHLAWRV